MGVIHVEHDDDRGWWALVVILCVLACGWVMFIAWLLNWRTIQ